MNEHADNCRSVAMNDYMVDGGFTEDGRKLMAAAAEIERLEAENARLRKFVKWLAVKECPEFCDSLDPCVACKAQELLRDIEPKEQGDE